jgi:hypothetical protein
MLLHIQNWTPAIDITQFVHITRAAYGTKQILTEIVNGQCFTLFQPLRVKKRQNSLHLYAENNYVGRIHATVIEQNKLLLNTILTIQVVLCYQQKTYIEITIV